MSHYNPERRAWRGRSYKNGGKQVRGLREALDHAFDLSDLSGDSTPCTLDDFLKANEECPPDPAEVESLVNANIGDKVNLGIGGGFITVTRVS